MRSIFAEYRWWHDKLERFAPLFSKRRVKSIEDRASSSIFFLPPNEGTTGKWTPLTQHAENQVESTRRECTRRLYNRCAIILELNAIILHESRTLREILRGHRARYTHTRRDAGIRVRWSFDCRWLYTCDANSEGKIDCETRASHRCV